jgi:autotransporter-associated beta strand protein
MSTSHSTAAASRVLLPGVLLCFCCAPGAPAGVVDYAILQDTRIDSRDNTTNFDYGTENVKLITNSLNPGDGSVVRGLLALPANLPATPPSQLYSAKIWFCQTWDYGPAGETPYTRGVAMYPLMSGFSASTVTWQSCGGGQYDATQPLAFTPAANIQESANWYWWCSWDFTSQYGSPQWSSSNLYNHGAIMMLNPETPPPADGTIATWVTKVFASSRYPGGSQYQPIVELVTLDQWNDANGNWTAAGSWTDRTPPNQLDAAAAFLANATQNRTVTVNAPVTVGTLLFDNSAHSYTLAGANTITISDLSGNAGAITVNHGNHVISAPLELDSNTTVTVANPGDSLTIGGAISGPASGIDTSLTLAGGGTLILSGSNSYTGGTSVQSGVLVAENASAIPGGSWLSIGASGSVVLGSPGFAELGLDSGGRPLDAGSGGASTVPEPATLALLAAAVVCGLATVRRPRRKNH